MKDLIEVFKMKEISIVNRCSLLIKLGQAINNEYGMNLTEPLVYELVSLLDQHHPILQDKHFKSLAGVE